MALINFYRGEYSHYIPSKKHKDSIYFAPDKRSIYMNGISYSFDKTQEHLLDRIESQDGYLILYYTDGTSMKLRLDLDSVYNVKGSLNSKEELLSIQTVEKGDVYNLSVETQLNGIKYPAYTNFVYVGETKDQAGEESNWDSLGGTVDFSEIENQLDKLTDAVFPFNITVSGGGIFEKRTSQDINVQWQTKEGQTPVVPDTISVNSTPMQNTDTSKLFEDVVTTTTFTVSATKDGNNAVGSTTALFVNPSFFGAVPSDFQINEDNIKALNKIIKDSKSYTATTELDNQKTCYAYPAQFGQLTAIKDANNFDYINSYTLSQVKVYDELYYIYLLTDATTITNFKQMYS